MEEDEVKKAEELLAKLKEVYTELFRVSLIDDKEYMDGLHLQGVIGDRIKKELKKS